MKCPMPFFNPLVIVELMGSLLFNLTESYHV